MRQGGFGRTSFTTCGSDPIIIPRMETSAPSSATAAALKAVQAASEAPSTERKAMAIAMLKKALEAQQRQADEIMRSVTGKGHQIDIRV